MLSNKSRKQNEKALGWTYEAATDLFRCVSGYGTGNLSPQIGGRVRGIKRQVTGSVARAGFRSGHSSAINLIIETSGWLQDCYFECLFIEKSDPQSDETSQVGRLAVTWGGLDSRNLVPCLQARITVDRHTFGEINRAFSGRNLEPSSITISMNKLENFTFDQFWDMMISHKIHSVDIIDFQINARAGVTELSKKYIRDNQNQEESFIFSQPH